MNTDAVKQAFREVVLAALGHAPAVIEPGRIQRFSTTHKPADNAGWCKLFDDLRGGAFGCHRQGIRETWNASEGAPSRRDERAALIRQSELAKKARASQQHSNARRIAQVWAQCVPLSPGDPVSTYLARRGLAVNYALPTVLRLHPALAYWQGPSMWTTFPAMVAPLVAPDGRVLALHRTYLTVEGHKADVHNPKKLTSTAGSLAGACIPLHEPIDGCIGIAEGIETALAAWQASSVPTVASYCAGNLAAWQWPASVRRLVIFADADHAGRDSAEALRRRARASRLQVDVLTPTTQGADWCDVWEAREAATSVAGGIA